MKILKEIFKRPITITFIVIISIFLGVMSATNMSINLLPDISFPYIAIKTTYVGADAQTVDETVTTPIENAVSNISDIHAVSTYSLDNASVVLLSFNFGIDIDEKDDEINKALDSITLPDKASKSELYSVNLNNNSLVTVTIYSTTDSLDDVYSDALNLKTEFESISGVGSVTFTGEPAKSISVEPLYGLEMISGLLVTSISTDASLDIPLGSIEGDDGSISINNTTSAKTIEQIKEIPISISLSDDLKKNFVSYQETINFIEKLSSDDLVDIKKALTSGSYSSLSNLPINQMTLSIVTSQNFSSNYEKLYQYKLNHEHEEQVYDSNTSTYVTKKVGDTLTNDQLYDLLNELDFSDIPSLQLSKKMIHLVRDYDYSTIDTLNVTIDEVSDVTLVTSNDSIAYYNSNQAIQIDVYGSSGSNATGIVRNVEKIIKNFNTSSNSEIVMLNNQASFISDSLTNALISLIIGGCLAIVVIYLFLRKVKSSLIIAVSMPLSILCTITCLHLMGITLNMVSVGGLAVGIGMLVDNSIVVLESITSERDSGKDALTASIDGVKTVIGSLIGSTLTSICVFFPILMFDGLTKEIFADLSWAVIFSLTFSLLVAVFIIPSLYCLLYKKENKNKEYKGKIMTKITNFYTNFLVKILKRKKTVLVISMLVFLASIALIFTTSIEFLPSIDQGKIEVTITYESGDSYEYCEQKTMEAYEKINSNIDNIENMNLRLGYSGYVTSNLTGKITINLDSKSDDTKDKVEEIREMLCSNFDHSFQIQDIDGVVATLTSEMSGVSVTIYGEDIDTLKEIAEKIETDVCTKKGIKYASDNMIANSTSLNITFDQEKLNEYGIDYTTLVETLRIGLAGYTCTNLSVDNQDLDVIVSFKDDSITSYYNGISNFVVGYYNGNQVLLSEVSQIVETNGRHTIKKVNGLNVLDISIESYGIDTNTASNYLQKSTKKILADYDGYTYQSSGVSYYLTDAFTGLVKALIISFFLLFAIMACLFESLKKPCIIIFSFPFAFSGGFIALAITRVSLNVVSFIGLIMLMGVIVNDAIILNERFDQLTELGYDKHEAIIEGCKQRLRAVLMTALTTILALIPMALGQGKGGELMQPLGVVAVGGLTIGTLVTLILIPCVYAIFYKIDFKDFNIQNDK